MYLWILLLIFGLRSLGVQGKGKQYECGENGRFEYCVDGVPGCVVGCHCHPGYYFDTETKICEPNTKLVQDYRRHFLAEPTRVQIPITPAYEIQVTPTLTTKTPLDNQVDQALAKDTDDIGDWLYNQFFKTIENQVLNATTDTDNNIDANNQTRRVGSGPTQKKTKRQRYTPKKIKFSKISKKDDLRRKLLRITEDDSLFDSDSRSSEVSKSSSNSDSSDTSLDTDDDFKSSDKKEKNHHNNHPNDKEHGHRKILVVNKKPKPPLPSFIFLPNLETPFYPPIGLPPPPPMPMYPMVPVPPMPFPPFPFTMVVPTESKDKTKAPKTTTDSHKHTTHTQPEKTTTLGHSTKKATTKNAAIDKDKDKPDLDKQALRNRMLKRKKLLRQFREKRPGPFEPYDHRKSTKHEPPINPLMPSVNDYMDMADLMEDMAPRESPPPPPGPPPVDFKYLSQLIHKMNPNTFNEHSKNKIAQPQRRFETPYYHQEQHPTPLEPILPAANELTQMPTHLPEGDDSYYANLGQQIASLIRKIDNAAPQTNPKTQSTYEGINSGDNGFASRSYWERSVRSLFSHYPPNTNDINFLKNEQNLLNLENKVKVVATTQRSWNLNELENVIFLVDRIKSRIHNMKIKNIQDAHKESLAKQTKVDVIEPLKSQKTSEAENLNINLLPRQNDILHGDKKEIYLVPERRNIPQIHITISETKNKTVNPLEEFINRQSIHYNLRGILMQNFKNILQKTDSQKQTLKYVTHNGTNIINKSIPKPIFEGTSLRKLIRMDQLQNLQKNKPLRPKLKPRVKPKPKHDDRSSERFLHNLKVLPKVSSSIQQLSPMQSNYKNAPLHSSRHNKYIFENDALAFQLAPAPTQQERAYYQVPHHHNYFD